MQQRGVPSIVGFIENDLRLLGGDIAQHALVILLHGIDGQCRLGQIGFGVVESDLILAGIEPVQHLAGTDALVVRNVDHLNDAGDVGRDGDFLGIDIGVIGRHHLAAGGVPVDASEEDERNNPKKTPAEFHGGDPAWASCSCRQLPANPSGGRPVRPSAPRARPVLRRVRDRWI